MPPQQETPQNQNPYESTQNNVNPPIVSGDPDTRKSKKKKYLALILAVVVAVIILGPVGYELAKVHIHANAFRNYVSSRDFKGFTTSNRTFLEDGNGVLAKMYSCQATSNDLWKAPTFSKIPFDVLDMQYTRFQSDLVIAREFARKTSPPPYKGGLLANILPAAKNEEQKYQNAKKLLDMSKSFAYVGADSHSDYCTRKLYPTLIPMSYLVSYAAYQDISSASVSDLEFRLQYADKALKGTLVPYKISPEPMLETDHQLNIWLTKVKADLTTLLEIRKKNGDVGNLQAAFVADKAQLDANVLSAASREGKDISASTDELRSLLNAISPFQK
jgi:hypothetical protein